MLILIYIYYVQVIVLVYVVYYQCYKFNDFVNNDMLTLFTILIKLIL